MFLVDTNLLSEMRRHGEGLAHPSVAAWLRMQTPQDLHISAITLFETEIGIRRMERRDPRQGAALRGWLNTGVLPLFGDRILPVDAAVATAAAGFHVPNPAPIADSLIAATALVHGLTVATRNAADFRLAGVAVLNPWEFPLPPPPGDEIS